MDILGNHTMSEVPTPTHIKELAAKLNKPIWNTEEHVYKSGFDCEISLVQVFNQNFIQNDVTKVVCWYLVSSFYPIEPYHKRHGDGRGFAVERTLRREPGALGVCALRPVRQDRLALSRWRLHQSRGRGSLVTLASGSGFQRDCGNERREDQSARELQNRRVRAEQTLRVAQQREGTIRPAR